MITLTLKSSVVQLRNNNIPILAEWNAGGDETCCNVSVNGEFGYETHFIKVSWKLGDLIAEKLQLPNAGEYYNNGGGVIDVNSSGQIVLTYSARAHYYDYEDENNSTIEWVSVEDRYGLNQHLHRISVQFFMHASKQNGILTYETYGLFPDIRILEGDEFTFTIPTESYYRKCIEEVLQKYEPEFNQLLEESGSKCLDSIEVTGHLQPDGIRLELQKTFVVVDLIDTDKTVVLID
jgi:hypothetical protein